MPSTVGDIFEKTNLKIMGQALWGEKIHSNKVGVYVVALSNSPEKLDCFKQAPILYEKVKSWIDCVPRMTIKNCKPTVDKLVEQLNKFWLSDETIIYIGQTSSTLEKRVNQLYRHKLGKGSPHRGGHWLKTLSVLDDVSIYWCETPNLDPQLVESKMIKEFIKGVSKESRLILYDKINPFPFANLEYKEYISEDGIYTKRKHIKRHGLKYQSL